MSKLSLGQKADRVLKFLLGMRNARVVAALATRGFGENDIDEGWSLLRNVARGKFDFTASAAVDPKIIGDIDRWENTWFPVVSATLQRRFPAIGDRLFLNLSQTEGAGVIFTVSTLLERLDGLRKATDQDSQEAMALLAKRGLTSAVMDDARSLLSAVGKPSAPISVELDTHQQDVGAAERELWNWYLEWSQIARSTISDRQLLRSLGFLAAPRSSTSDEEEEDEAPADPPQGNTPSGFAPALNGQSSRQAS